MARQRPKTGAYRWPSNGALPRHRGLRGDTAHGGHGRCPRVGQLAVVRLVLRLLAHRGQPVGRGRDLPRSPRPPTQPRGVRQRRPYGGLLLRGGPRDQAGDGGRRVATTPRRCAPHRRSARRHGRTRPHLPGVQPFRCGLDRLGHPHGDRHRVRRRCRLAAGPAGAHIAEGLPPEPCHRR